MELNKSTFYQNILIVYHCIFLFRLVDSGFQLTHTDWFITKLKLTDLIWFLLCCWIFLIVLSASQLINLELEEIICFVIYKLAEIIANLPQMIKFLLKDASVVVQWSRMHWSLDPLKVVTSLPLRTWTGEDELRNLARTSCDWSAWRWSCPPPGPTAGYSSCCLPRWSAGRWTG